MRFLLRNIVLVGAATISLGGAACGMNNADTDRAQASAANLSDRPQPQSDTVASSSAPMPDGEGKATPYNLPEGLGLFNDTALAAIKEARQHFGGSLFGVRIDPEAKRLTLSTFGPPTGDRPAKFHGVPADYVTAERSPAEAAYIAQEFQTQATNAYAPAYSPVGVSPHDLSGGIVITSPKLPTERETAMVTALLTRASLRGVTVEVWYLDDQVRPAN